MTLRTAVMYALAIGASIGVAVLAYAIKRGAFQHLDVALEMTMHRLDSTPADIVMKTATVVGSNYVVVPALAAVVLLAIHLRARYAAVILVVDAVVVHVVDQVMKLMFARERPHLFDKIALPSDYSFPSGHAMGAIGILGVCAVVLGMLYPRWHRAIVLAAIPVIALIGLSRIYLGVHWPSDVLGGYLAGVPPFVVAEYLLHHRRMSDPRGKTQPWPSSTSGTAPWIPPSR